MFSLVGLLVGCGSAHRATYTGRLYSLAAVKNAFAQLGLRLQPGLTQPGVRRFHLEVSIGGRLAGRGGTVVVATDRSAVGSTSLPGREIAYANVSVFTKSDVVDEIRGGLSALRWGTMAQLERGQGSIVPGKSIGPIRLGETRKAIERTFGRGKQIRGPLEVSYLDGHVIVYYTFHDTTTNYAAELVTRWRGYRTASGAGVGSPVTAMRPLFATCVGKTSCYLLQGQWPDALATRFNFRAGRVAQITIGNS